MGTAHPRVLGKVQPCPRRWEPQRAQHRLLRAASGSEPGPAQSSAPPGASPDLYPGNRRAIPACAHTHTTHTAGDKPPPRSEGSTGPLRTGRVPSDTHLGRAAAFPSRPRGGEKRGRRSTFCLSPNTGYREVSPTLSRPALRHDKSPPGAARAPRCHCGRSAPPRRPRPRPGPAVRAPHPTQGPTADPEPPSPSRPHRHPPRSRPFPGRGKRARGSPAARDSRHRAHSGGSSPWRQAALMFPGGRAGGKAGTEGPPALFPTPGCSLHPPETHRPMLPLTPGLRSLRQSVSCYADPSHVSRVTTGGGGKRGKRGEGIAVAGERDGRWNSPIRHLFRTHAEQPQNTWTIIPAGTFSGRLLPPPLPPTCLWACAKASLSSGL